MTSSTSSAQLEAHLEVSCFQQVLGIHAAKNQALFMLGPKAKFIHLLEKL